MDWCEACSYCGTVVGGPEPQPFGSCCPRCGARTPWRRATPEEAADWRKRQAWQRRYDEATSRTGAERFWESPMGRRLSLLAFVAIVFASCWGPGEDEED